MIQYVCDGLRRLQRIWNKFVKNRLTEIKEKTNLFNWHYCSEKENLADKVIRAMYSHILMNHTIWFSDRIWLWMVELPFDASQIKFYSEIHIEELEREMNVIQACQEPKYPLFGIHWYSSLNKILKVTAYILHFIRN